MEYVSTEIKNLLFVMNKKQSNVSYIFALYTAEEIKKVIRSCKFYLANIFINEDADDIELLMLMAQNSLLTKNN